MAEIRESELERLLMGKKKQAEVLIKGMEGARYGESEGHWRLFLPRFLAGDADDFKLRDAAQERAYAILVRWADLELSGKLGRKKETSLQGEFLTEVFGRFGRTKRRGF